MGVVRTVQLDSRLSGRNRERRTVGEVTIEPTTSNVATAEGWHPDPEGWDRLRYFDGEQWTNHYHPEQPTDGGPGLLRMAGATGPLRTKTPEELRELADAAWEGGSTKLGAFNPINYWVRATFIDYFNFRGRATRSEYWCTVLIDTVVYLGLGYLAFRDVEQGRPISLSPLDESIAAAPFYLLVGFALFTIVRSLSLQIRRLHDTNRSAWWLAAIFVPFGSLILFVLMWFDSTPGRNRYGPSPKFR